MQVYIVNMDSRINTFGLRNIPRRIPGPHKIIFHTGRAVCCVAIDFATSVLVV